MGYIKYFKDVFESIPVYRKIVVLMFLNKNDGNLLNNCGFLKNDKNRLGWEHNIILMEQNEEHWEYINNEEESVFEKVLKK